MFMHACTHAQQTTAVAPTSSTPLSTRLLLLLLLPVPHRAWLELHTDALLLQDVEAGAPGAAEALLGTYPDDTVRVHAHT
jgi:hypothetical protein